MAIHIPFVRSPYNYDVEQASDEVATAPGGESMTVQSMADDADINVLMQRYGLLGTLPPQGMRVPEYGDYTGVSDFRSALEAVRGAEDNFMQMPAAMRARFENNPQLFLDFCSNPDNIPAMREMGLMKSEVSRGTGNDAVATGVSGGAGGSVSHHGEGNSQGSGGSGSAGVAGAPGGPASAGK